MKYAWTPLGQIPEDFKGEAKLFLIASLFCFWLEVGENFWRENPLESFVLWKVITFSTHALTMKPQKPKLY